MYERKIYFVFFARNSTFIYFSLFLSLSFTTKGSPSKKIMIVKPSKMTDKSVHFNVNEDEEQLQLKKDKKTLSSVNSKDTEKLDKVPLKELLKLNIPDWYLVIPGWYSVGLPLINQMINVYCLIMYTCTCRCYIFSYSRCDVSTNFHHIQQHTRSNF